jgi:hypothetical protein
MPQERKFQQHISARQLCKYLVQYVEVYRREYQRFVQEPPTGGGFPPLDISPYLHTQHLHGYLANDGIAIADYSWQPDAAWALSGGPAIIVDMVESKTPQGIQQLSEAAKQSGESLGLYRIVSQHPLPARIWSGQLPKPTATQAMSGEGFQVTVSQYPIAWRELLAILTFGGIGILDLQLPTSVGAPFWNPRIIRDLGFASADSRQQRFFHYLELLRHVEHAALDVRGIWARVHVDIRRDFAAAVGRVERGFGGEMAFDSTELRFVDRLTALERAISAFEALLAASTTTDEATYHEFLRTHPVLLDVYATAYSKPRLVYPAGEAPLGKSYVEPDFILRYPDNTYRLVELEKPRDLVTTRSGHPRAEVTHAVFQIAEWKDFILNHYEVIKSKFPRISSAMRSTVVIGRTQGTDADRRALLVR